MADTTAFQFGHRREWCDLVRPPTGFRLTAAIGTTYNLEPVALTALLLALVDGDSDRREDDADVLRAITKLSDRVRVFLHRGRLSVDTRTQATVNPVFGLLDRIICEIRPDDASFHPKVWVLRYDPLEASGPAIVRWMCGSRNVSPSNAWELFVAFDGVVQANGGEREGSGNLATFVESLLRIDGRASGPLHSLVDAVRNAQFRFSDSLKRADFHWQGDGRSRLVDLIGSGEAALVVSPFLGKRLLEQLQRRFKRLHVLSRQEALDESARELLGEKLHAWVMSDGDDEGTMNLHAKLLVCQRHDSNVEAFLGSANATTPGWGLSPPGNWEAVVHFPVAATFDDLLRDFGCSQDGGLGWVEAYRPGVPPELDAESEAVELLDELSEHMSRLAFTAHFDAESPSLWLGTSTPVQLRELARQIGRWGSVEVRPLACPTATPVALVALETGCQFGQLQTHEVSELIWVHALHTATGRKKDFAIKTLLAVPEGFWEDRRIAALRAFLTREKFLAYLQAILLDRFARRPLHAPPPPPNAGSGGNANMADVFHVLAAEQVMHACLDDPSRFDEVDDLLRMFEPTGLVDPGFVQFWHAFRV